MSIIAGMKNAQSLTIYWRDKWKQKNQIFTRSYHGLEIKLDLLKRNLATHSLKTNKQTSMLFWKR